jgi:hypothetical protein
MTTARGHFWFALGPDADEGAFTRLMSGLKSEEVLQSTRLTIAFHERFLKVVAPGDGSGDGGGDGGEVTAPRPAEYVWEATVDLMEDHPYDFAGSAGQLRDVVGDLATLVSVEVPQSR